MSNQETPVKEVKEVVEKVNETHKENTVEPKPKRKCSEKQLAALAAGRAKNSRFRKKE